MALSTTATASSAVQNNGQILTISKPNPSAGVALTPHSLWAGNGYPGAAAGTYGTTGRANGRVLTDASVGGVPYQNAPSGQMYVMGAGMSPAAATCTGTAYLIDRVADCALAHAEATGAITGLTATSRLPTAGATALGCQIWIYVSGALSAASNVFTLTYTNMNGASKTTPNITTVASAVANRSINANMFVQLAADDIGVRSIDSITAVSGAGTGTICVCLVRVLARVTLPLINTPIERSYIVETPGWKPIYDDTCFDWILVPTGAAANGTAMNGYIQIASG